LLTVEFADNGKHKRELPNWTDIYRTKIRIPNKTAANLICIKYTWWNFDCNLYCFIFLKNI